MEKKDLLQAAFEVGKKSRVADTEFINVCILPASTSKESALIELRKQLSIKWPKLEFRPSNEKTGYVQRMPEEHACYDRLRKNPAILALPSEKGSTEKTVDPAQDFARLCKKYEKLGRLSELIAAVKKVVC